MPEMQLPVEVEKQLTEMGGEALAVTGLDGWRQVGIEPNELYVRPNRSVLDSVAVRAGKVRGFGSCTLSATVDGAQGLHFILEAQPSPEDRQLLLGVFRSYCSPGNYVIPISSWVEIDDDTVIVIVFEEPAADPNEFRACAPSLDPYSIVVELPAGVGGRLILNGATVPPSPPARP